jgi:hypothetical protein
MRRSGSLGWNRAWNRRKIESHATKRLVDRADPHAQESEGSQLHRRKRRDDHLGERGGREDVRRSQTPSVRNSRRARGCAARSAAARAEAAGRHTHRLRGGGLHRRRSPPAGRDQLGADREWRRLPRGLRSRSARQAARSRGPDAAADGTPERGAAAPRGGRIDRADRGDAPREQGNGSHHIRHILRALGAHSRLEAVAKAHRQGLLPDD